ncbi:hypothetical protein HYFRA_00013862 [Hymenoscyphus fraxineus]|uniref:Uncharacterized protein n=1 Tax=Hymenoscyphus fraxineus TaxID=746836 RepID=A0A9N9L785_9HELO|nr:hypothetical protein HYFRA_00013862 [Hymenoscyphus fraxineus]
MTSHPDFGKHTNAEEVTSRFANQIAGKTILLTGTSPNSLSNTLAHSLASQNPRLLILCGRTPTNILAVASSLKTSYPQVTTHTLPFDLSHLPSVRAAASALLTYDKNLKIDILINNAV